MKVGRRVGTSLLALLLAVPARGAPEPAEALRDRDVAVRLSGVERLRTDRPAAAEKLLLDALRDREWEVVEAAAAALGDVGSEASVGPLVDLCVKGPVRRLRLAAARSLAKLAPEAALAGLPLRGDDEEHVRGLEALREIALRMPGGDAAEAVERALRSKEPLVRAAAARALLVLPAPDRAEKLRKLAFDSDLVVACAAVDALRLHPQNAHLEPLLDLCGAAELLPVVDRRVRSALAATVASGGDVAAASTAVLERAQDPLQAAAAERFARLLGEIGARPAADPAAAEGDAPAAPLVAAEAVLKVLLPMSGRPEPGVRAAAARALGAVATDEAVARATEIAAQDADARVRLVALRAVRAARGARDAAAATLFRDRLEKDAHPLVREEAAVALGVRGAADGVPALEAAARRAAATRDGSEWAVGSCALVSLGKTGSPDAVAMLRHAASKEVKDWRLRGAAVVGMGHLRNKDVVPDLIEALDAKEPVIRATAFEFLRRMTTADVPPKASAWADWWRKEGPDYAFLDPEEEARKAQKYGYAPTSVGVYEGLDVIVLESRGDHIQDLLTHLGVEHRMTRPGQLLKDAVHPHAVYVSNCTGEILDKDIEPLAWFVRVGGYLFGSCWSLEKTIEKVYPGVLRKLPTRAQVLEYNVPAEACEAESPFLDGVFPQSVRPSYVLYGAHLIEVLDPDRAEVLIDSPHTARNWGGGDLAAWFEAGHGIVLDSVNHFDLQGFEKAEGLKTAADRMAFAIDHLGLGYAEVREIDGKVWDSSNRASKEAKDLSAFRFVTNFVRMKRRQGL